MAALCVLLIPAIPGIKQTPFQLLISPQPSTQQERAAPNPLQQ